MDRVAQGGTITFTVTFEDSTGALVDPVDPEVAILDPDEVELVSDIPTRNALGLYSFQHTAASDATLGVWRLRWGGVIDGLLSFGDEFFNVIPPGGVVIVGQQSYATLVETKLFLGIPPTDTEDDPLLELALDAASREIDKFCDRTFTNDIPAPVRQACLLQAGRLWKRKDSLFGVAGSPEFGSELRLLSRLDPDVEVLLRGYRHRWWVA